MSSASSVQHKENRAGKPTGFQPGKIPHIVLERSVFPYLGKRSRRVIAGPGIGRDAAIVRLNTNRLLIFSTDPITAAVRHIGRHAVHVNANDVAVSGAKPEWFLCTLLVPPGSKESQLRQIMREVDVAARGMGISVVRGHTEATPGLKHPILAGFMIGESHHGRFLTSDGAVEGDIVIMTKTAGIEGTVVLAADYQRVLKKSGVAGSIIKKAERLAGLISIVPEAATAAKMDGVTAMHDPTEGGVVNGLWELAEASRVGIEIDGDKIPVAPETHIISHALGLDPLKLLGSGSLLITCDPSKSEHIVRALRKRRIMATKIGHLTNKISQRVIRRDGRYTPLLPVYKDELYTI